MLKRAGQAVHGFARRWTRLLHLLAQLALALVILTAVALAVLAWRLSSGPIALPWLTQRLEAAANSDSGPTRLSIGAASLAWEGFSQGVDRPVDIQIDDVAAFDARGQRIAHIPHAEISLSVGWLILGRLVPRAIELQGVRLRLLRAPDGAITPDLGSLTESTDEAAPPAAPAPPAEDAAPQDTGALLQTLLHQFAQAPQRDRAADLSRLGGARWSQLRRVRVRDAGLTMVDRQLAITWHADGIALDLQRHTGGGVDGGGKAALRLGDQQAQFTFTASMPAGPSPAITLTAHLSTIRPAALAAIAPRLAALAAVDLPVTLAATAELGGTVATPHLRLQTTLGAGRLRLANGYMPLRSATIETDATAQAVDMKILRLVTAPSPDGPRTTIRGRLTAHRDGALVRAHVGIDLDQVAFADLGAIWPPGLGGKGTQPWITENITGGTASDGHVELDLLAPGDLSDVELTAISGGMAGHDLSVTWLAPVPPIEHAEAQLTFTSQDVLDIAVQGGRQSGGQLTLRTGHMRISGLSVHDQFADIDGDLSGPLADLLAVLRHPKLKLLDRRPIPMTNPSGQISGHLSVAHLPLEFNVSVDDIAIKAQGRLTDVHLGAIAAGRDLDGGTLDMTASNDGLQVKGTAQLAGIPSQLQVDMDFHDGPPSQVIQKVAVSATADASQFARAGIDTLGLLPGPVGLQVAMQTRRDGRGDIGVQADFSRTALRIDRLNWSKPETAAAHGELHALLDHDRVTGIDRLTLQGDGIDVRTQVLFAAGKPTGLQLERVKLGEATDLQGELRWPAAPGAPWIANLTGRSLDASAQFARRSDKAKPANDDERGPAYSVDVRLGRVLMAKGTAITDAVAHVESDGLITSRAHVSGKTGGAAGFVLDIVPAGQTRRLSAHAADAGSLLRALDVIPDMQGGTMTTSGVFDDSTAAHTLSGSSEIADFRMRNAPALGKLLQAMTLYGLVEVMQGPGLGFSRLVAPFRLTHDLLDIDDARAFSASLGMTAKGRLDLGRNTCEIQGTIVPAYFFNTLLGRIPLVGRLFSPEAGGGLFAATYGLHGSCDDPTVSVNPLAALTPGFLRGMFDIFDQPAGTRPDAPQPGASQPAPKPPAPPPAVHDGGRN